MFYTCVEVAGDLEQDGALFVRGAGPMTVAEIADEVGPGITEAQTKKGLDALIKIGFVGLREDGAYVIAKWAEKTAPEISTARVKQHRERKRNVSGNVSETQTERSGNRAEEEVEEEYSAPIGAAAPPFLIAEDETPERLARPYLEAFLHCKSATARARHRATVVGYLRDMHAEGYTWHDIFTAAHQAHADGEGAPLRGSGAVWAMLRGITRRRKTDGARDARDIGGADATAAIGARIKVLQ